jgi:two-component system, OmpR family, phosphate regulon response regulator PhoB
MLVKPATGELGMTSNGMKKKKVLIVDDELDMRIFLSTLLETNGYKPVVSTDGMEGIRKAREIKPDLIVLDVMMPKAGGVQMYRDLRVDSELEGIPVIMLSGIAKKTFFHSQNVLDSYMDQSVREPDAYIEKPPEAEEFLQSVRGLLNM